MKRPKLVDMVVATIFAVAILCLLVAIVVKWDGFWALLATQGHMLGSLGAIVLGVVLGMLTTSYQERGQNVDELNIRRNKIQAGLNRDQVPDPFRAAIEEHFVDVESAIRAQSWMKGDTELGKAEAVWDRWRKYQSYWVLHLAACDSLLRRTRAMRSDTAGVQKLLGELETLEREALLEQDKSPRVLRAELARLAAQIDRYGGVYDSLSECRARAVRASAASEWRPKEKDFLKKLRTLDSSSGEGFDALIEEIEEAAGQLPTPDSNGPGTETKLTDPASAASTVPTHAPGGTSRVQNLIHGVWYAEWRRHLFGLISHAITVILLTQVGFRQLYLQHADDINKWAFSNANDVPKLFDHYVALVLWGFSSEASRRVVTEVFRTNRPQSDVKPPATPPKAQ